MHKNPTVMRRESLRQTAELYKKGTKVMQVSLKDDEEAKGEPPVSERNESSENNDSRAARDKIRLPLVVAQSEKTSEFNLSVEG